MLPGPAKRAFASAVWSKKRRDTAATSSIVAGLTS